MSYKVAHVITGLSTGGAEAMLIKLLTEMQTMGVESTVISLTNMGTMGKKIQKIGVPVFTLSMQPAKPTISALLRLRNQILAINPDLIQGWMYHGNIASSFAFIPVFHRIPVVWNIRHSLDHITLEKPSTVRIIRLGGKLSWLPKKIIFNSHHSATQHTTMGYSKKRSAILPNGFNCTQYAPSTKKRMLIRKELGISEEKILIGMIGRFHPNKDHRNFFRAAGILNNRHENVCFLCAGYQVEASNSEIMAMVNDYGLGGVVHLLGERQDTSALAASLDIASLSSVSESFPNVVGEAMACEVPCVVTDVGDAQRIIGDTGRVVPIGNSNAMADAWSLLIGIGSGRRKDLGRKARKRIIDEFSLQKIGKEYDCLYRSIIGVE